MSERRFLIGNGDDFFTWNPCAGGWRSQSTMSAGTVKAAPTGWMSVGQNPFELVPAELMDAFRKANKDEEHHPDCNHPYVDCSCGRAEVEALL